jgi:hypothetical protein
MTGYVPISYDESRVYIKKAQALPSKQTSPLNAYVLLNRDEAIKEQHLGLPKNQRPKVVAKLRPPGPSCSYPYTAVSSSPVEVCWAESRLEVSCSTLSIRVPPPPVARCDRRNCRFRSPALHDDLLRMHVTDRQRAHPSSWVRTTVRRPNYYNRANSVADADRYVRKSCSVRFPYRPRLFPNG